jgi:putative toxin-antitoxin system antitoxin component (TIGR02293 family)
MSAMSVELTELADSLGMVVGNHGRRNRDGSFSRAETARLLRVAHVLDLAERRLGDRTRGLQWLKHQNRALSFATPLSLLETRVGTERVIALLDRIGGGAFA